MLNATRLSKNTPPNRRGVFMLTYYVSLEQTYTDYVFAVTYHYPFHSALLSKFSARLDKSNKTPSSVTDNFLGLISFTQKTPTGK